MKRGWEVFDLEAGLLAGGRRVARGLWGEQATSQLCLLWGQAPLRLQSPPLFPLREQVCPQGSVEQRSFVSKGKNNVIHLRVEFA